MTPAFGELRADTGRTMSIFRRGTVGAAFILLLLPGCLPGRSGRPTTEAGARPESFAALAARVERRVTALPGAVVGVAYRDLETGDTLYINADTSFHAAS